ncbi:putative methyltransferase [bacterium HR33]|nr:putative methyltransferase [bacterium HR33]
MPFTFQDHFSGTAPEYARYRPGYPEALFDFLARVCPERGLAWDCATGNGQAAVSLARRFRAVIATDASRKQLANAFRRPNVFYWVASEADSGIPAGSVDLVTAAQALHWFDREAFYREVRRVSKPCGVIAVWCYRRFSVSPEIDRLVNRFNTELVGPYWPYDRQVVDSGYRSLDFPFDELRVPEFAIQQSWTLAELGKYIETWSSVKRFRELRGQNPVPGLLEQLREVWGDPEERRIVRWPLAVRAGYVFGKAGE